jgi:SM-20-related protein
MSPLDAAPHVTLRQADEIGRVLRKDGYVRIDGVLDPRVADALRAHLEVTETWVTTFWQGAKGREIAPEQREAMGDDRITAMSYAGADRHFRYLFDILPIADARDEKPPSDPIFGPWVEAWLSPPAREIWRRILRRNDATRMEALASRYRRGHFLNKHDDGRDPWRIAAFVLSLSPEWHSDWGGQLQFVNPAGDVERGLVPQYNSLVLFAVPKLHAVSAVSPFAPAPRFSIAGWLCRQPDDPSE